MLRILSAILCVGIVLPGEAKAGLFKRRAVAACNNVACVNEVAVVQQQVAVTAVPVAAVPLAVDLAAYQYTINPSVYTQQFASLMAGQPVAQATTAQNNNEDAIDALAAKLAAKLNLDKKPDSESSSVKTTGYSGSGEVGGLLPFDKLPSEVQNSKYAGVAVMKTMCAQCHTGATAKKKFVMFSDDGTFIGNLDYWKIHKRVSSSDPKTIMPPSGKMTEEQIKSVYDALVPNGIYNPFAS